MKFKINVWDLNHPENVNEDEVEAPNANELITMYKMIGQGVKILDAMGEPKKGPLETELEKAKNKLPLVQSPNQDNKVVNSPIVENKESFIYFNDNGVEFKVSNKGEVFKKEWSIIESDDYRVNILSNKNIDFKTESVLKDISNYIAIEKLDWVKVTTGEVKQ